LTNTSSIANEKEKYYWLNIISICMENINFNIKFIFVINSIIFIFQYKVVVLVRDINKNIFLNSLKKKQLIHKTIDIFDQKYIYSFCKLKLMWQHSQVSERVHKPNTQNHLTQTFLEKITHVTCMTCVWLHFHSFNHWFIYK
jgi:hypothetical protein